MSGDIQKQSVGRPTVRSEEIERKLEDWFKLGMSDTASCAYAGIARDTFYRWMREDDSFSDRMTHAKNYAMQLSRSIVVKELEQKRDVDTAKWYIEKHDDKQPQIQQNTQVNVFANLKDKYTIDSTTVSQSDQGTQENRSTTPDDSDSGVETAQKESEAV